MSPRDAPTAATRVFVLAAVALDGAAALVAGLVPDGWLERAREPLIGLASGVLLATAFLDVLPEALRDLPAATALTLVSA
jgi:hypothetical protein